MWLFPFSIWNPATSIINAQIRLCDSSNKSLDGVLYLYCNVVIYLLAKYATDHVITVAVSNITNCAQLQNITSVSYAQTLCDKSLRCRSVYDEAPLELVFIEDLPKSICSLMHHPWDRNKLPSITLLVQHYNSLHTLQTRMNQAIHRKDDKTYNRHNTWLTLEPNEHATLDVRFSSSDSYTQTGDHAKAFFTLENGQP